MVHLFIFRRDLRLDDNIGWMRLINKLLASASSPSKIMPIFIFNKKQISEKNNPYFSSNTVQFMIESIVSLNSQLKSMSQNKLQLQVFETTFSDVQVLDKLHKVHSLQSVVFNRDITPFARQRDDQIISWCNKNKIPVDASFDEYCLVNPSTMQKPYMVYGAFLKRYQKMMPPRHQACPKLKRVSLPSKPTKGTIPIGKLMKRYIKKYNDRISVKGGRHHGIMILKNINKGVFSKYTKTREIPSKVQGTTLLSAYLKYGCVSVREAYHAVVKAHSKSHVLLREFFWRSFYDQVVYHYPRVLAGQVGNGKNKSLFAKYDRIKWAWSQKHFIAWSTGNTGFPIVDAGMNQLNKTGYMHNRIRMVVASFLVRDLHIDWRDGEKYFATKLVDYYPSANNQGWNFISGGGASAQMYTRIFNPWLQSAKYDPDCKYIKKWVPRLGNVPSNDIHKWYATYKDHTGVQYPAPIVDHQKEARKSLIAYRKWLK